MNAAQLFSAARLRIGFRICLCPIQYFRAAAVLPGRVIGGKIIAIVATLVVTWSIRTRLRDTSEPRIIAIHNAGAHIALKQIVSLRSSISSGFRRYITYLAAFPAHKHELSSIGIVQFCDKDGVWA